MHMKLWLRNKSTGKLLGSNYFSCPRLVVEARSLLEKRGEWDHEVILDGCSLPYFFLPGGVPMFCMKQADGLLWGDWGKSRGGVIRKFKNSSERTDALQGIGNQDLADDSKWLVIDQCGRPTFPGRDYNFREHAASPVQHRAGQKDGKYGIVIRWGGLEYLVIKANGKGWSPSIHGLKQFISRNDTCWKLQNNTKVPVPGLMVVEKLDDGSIVDLPEIDLFL